MRTTDAGATWQNTHDEAHRWPVLDLAISPAVAADNTVYAATDMGLMRSPDRGDTWNHSGAACLVVSMAQCAKSTVCACRPISQPMVS